MTDALHDCSTCCHFWECIRMFANKMLDGGCSRYASEFATEEDLYDSDGQDGGERE